MKLSYINPATQSLAHVQNKFAERIDAGGLPGDSRSAALRGLRAAKPSFSHSRSISELSKRESVWSAGSLMELHMLQSRYGTTRLDESGLAILP